MTTPRLPKQRSCVSPAATRGPSLERAILIGRHVLGHRQRTSPALRLSKNSTCSQPRLPQAREDTDKARDMGAQGRVVSHRGRTVASSFSSPPLRTRLAHSKVDHEFRLSALLFETMAVTTRARCFLHMQKPESGPSAPGSAVSVATHRLHVHFIVRKALPLMHGLRT